MARERTERQASEAKAQKNKEKGKAPAAVTNSKKRKAAGRIADVIDEEVCLRMACRRMLLNPMVDKQDLAQGKQSQRLTNKTEKVSLQARQPALVTGATLKDYQLDGVEVSDHRVLLDGI